ncbi:MAG: hypothetical protein M5R42_01485 [Rhodocyclaceae bacterium]|nr:hypothetical protein [Rhodocyclaceae bacterium]
MVRTHHLFGGTEVVIRPIRPADAGIEAGFVRGLSERFPLQPLHGPVAGAGAARKLRYCRDRLGEKHMALIATVMRDGHRSKSA